MVADAVAMVSIVFIRTGGLESSTHDRFDLSEWDLLLLRFDQILSHRSAQIVVWQDLTPTWTPLLRINVKP